MWGFKLIEILCMGIDGHRVHGYGVSRLWGYWVIDFDFSRVRSLHRFWVRVFKVIRFFDIEFEAEAYKVRGYNVWRI